MVFWSVDMVFFARMGGKIMLCKSLKYPKSSIETFLPEKS